MALHDKILQIIPTLQKHYKPLWNAYICHQRNLHSKWQVQDISFYKSMWTKHPNPRHGAAIGSFKDPPMVEVNSILLNTNVYCVSLTCPSYSSLFFDLYLSAICLCSKNFLILLKFETGKVWKQTWKIWLILAETTKCDPSIGNHCWRSSDAAQPCLMTRREARNTAVSNQAVLWLWAQLQNCDKSWDNNWSNNRLSKQSAPGPPQLPDFKSRGFWSGTEDEISGRRIRACYI